MDPPEDGGLLFTLAHEVHAERVDESGLAGSGHAGDADTAGVAGVIEDAFENLLSEIGVSGEVAFDDCDGAGEEDAIACKNPFDVGPGRQTAPLGPLPARSRAGIRCVKRHSVSP